jgi:hypothetical protein
LFRLTSSNSPYTYRNLRDAWASVMADMLQAFEWDWWVSLTSVNPMPLPIIRNRFFWWLRVLRRAVGRHVEVIWIIERQRRGALHVHAVIHGVPKDNLLFWRAMINVWETYYTKPGEKFGDANIKAYNSGKAGELADYLAKERCKDLNILEGSGSIFEKFGFSRGVKKFYDAGVDVRDYRDLMSLVSGESINAHSNEPEQPEGQGLTQATLSTIKQ